MMAISEMINKKESLKVKQNQKYNSPELILLNGFNFLMDKFSVIVGRI